MTKVQNQAHDRFVACFRCLRFLRFKKVDMIDVQSLLP